MGKISNYARVLVAKLQDVFVVDQTDNNVTTTKSVTVEQIGDAICGEQVHADLKTDSQTIIGGINENKDKVGDLSTLTTTDKSSIVGAVNEVNGKLPTWVTQASDTNSGTIAGASVFGYYYADQWQAYIYLPFVTKNTNYTVNITSVSADNIGDITSKCSVVAKQNGYFIVRTTKTMSNLPDYYSVCPMRIFYSINFA